MVAYTSDTRKARTGLVRALAGRGYLFGAEPVARAFSAVAISGSAGVSTSAKESCGTSKRMARASRALACASVHVRPWEAPP